MKSLLTVSIFILLFLGTAFSQGPVGYWRLEENGVGTLYDSSGNGYNGTFTGGPTSYIGTKGRCLDFVGGTTGQYATVPDNTVLRDTTTNRITLAAWVRSDLAATQSIVKKNGTGNGYELSLSNNVPALPQNYFFRLNGSDNYRINSKTYYPIDGTWSHIAATYDGSVMKLYINGVLDSSKAKTVTIAANTNPLTIGTDAATINTKNFNGRIDEVRVYNRALSDAEILVLAQTKTWSGATNTRWDTTSNWNPRGVPTNANDLTIMNVTNLCSLTVNGTCRDLLVMNGAKIKTGSYALTTEGTINYDGDGRVLGLLTRNALSGTGKKYLMSANNYLDVTTAGITSLTIQEFAGTPPPNTPPEYDATRSVNRYYEISSVTGTGNVNPRFDYLLSEKGSNLVATDGVVWQYTVGTWVNMGGTGAAYYAETTTPVAGANLAGKYVVAAAAAALPVQLTSFVGNFVGNSAKLEWSTLSEVNNYGFNVQRFNGNSKTYETVGFVAGKGTTLQPQTYTYLDENVTGSVEYRLEQIDNNGLKNYFGPIMLNPNGVDDPLANGPAVFRLNQNYPNPFNPTTNISFSLENSGYTTLRVFNMIGQEVATLFNNFAEAAKLYTINFKATNLPSGMYFSKLQSGSNVAVRKLVLMK